MEIAHRILDLLKSDDLEMKNLAMSLLISQEENASKMDDIIKECIKHPFYCKIEMDIFTGARSYTVIRENLSGIWNQLSTGYRHTYNPSTFSLKTLTEAIDTHLKSTKK